MILCRGEGSEEAIRRSMYHLACPSLRHLRVCLERKVWRGWSCVGLVHCGLPSVPTLKEGSCIVEPQWSSLRDFCLSLTGTAGRSSPPAALCPTTKSPHSIGRPIELTELTSNLPGTLFHSLSRLVLILCLSLVSNLSFQRGLIIFLTNIELWPQIWDHLFWLSIHTIVYKAIFLKEHLPSPSLYFHYVFMNRYWTDTGSCMFNLYCIKIALLG